MEEIAIFKEMEGSLEQTKMMLFLFVHSVKNTALKKNLILISTSWLKDQPEQVSPLKKSQIKQPSHDELSSISFTLFSFGW